uniref:Large ribosomal subunit protein uL23c n=1 Tax=Compsopogon caeruleus TaxID=31354 RepID=A0A1Z1XB77_9RHOD|nr:chloroplast 50S ribosomal protein L23 [Compsopogon caeruleus]ARX96078.1 chloroplast 50S ribosomal protein L23 [Compsopogon caeruleus]
MTSKSTKLIEENCYSFAVDIKANKLIIKQAIEYLFEVSVISVNIINPPKKKRRIGKFIGNRSQYKKAYIRLAKGSSIKLFVTI